MLEPLGEIVAMGRGRTCHVSLKMAVVQISVGGIFVVSTDFCLVDVMTHLTTAIRLDRAADGPSLHKDPP